MADLVVEDGDNVILEDNDGENAINNVYKSSQTGCDFDGNNQTCELQYELVEHVQELH
ncbi:hypothetical protein Goshw_028799 [Gossypium schwendimanii]|uniref:Uncharacterized protein n=1 Tax=Gossypium schwendimanii TaxID=34291 RepID=A0A7J9M8Z8_GOSSC|nr:hypothetical protein [Gossypium schwendimanii]